MIRRDAEGTFRTAIGPHCYRPALLSARTAIGRPALGADNGGLVFSIFYRNSRIKPRLKDDRAMPLRASSTSRRPGQAIIPSASPKSTSPSN